MSLAPVAAGYLVDQRGGAAALWLAAILWLAALPALGLFRVLQRPWRSRARVRRLSRGTVSLPLAAILDAPGDGWSGAWPIAARACCRRADGGTMARG